MEGEVDRAVASPTFLIVMVGARVTGSNVTDSTIRSAVGFGTSSSLLASFDSATEPNSSARALTDATDAMRVSRVNSEFARQSLRALSQKDPEKVSVICMVASGARPAVDTLRASKLKI